MAGAVGSTTPTAVSRTTSSAKATSSRSNATEMQNAYNLDAEYAIGLLDVPHKITMAPIFELPFGEGKRWASSGVGAAILGDWTVSSIVALRKRLPDFAVRAERRTPASSRACSAQTRARAIPRPTAPRDDRLAAGTVAGARRTSSRPAAFSLGTLPRNLDDVRTPHRNNWDFVGQQGHPLRRQRPRADQARSAEHHQHRQGPRSRITRGQRSSTASSALSPASCD